MIPESAGATPTGIFLLADDYLEAAKLNLARQRRSSHGPTRLLSYHAAELFLKTYMRASGETIEALRNQGHDLEAMVLRAVELGLCLPPQILVKATKMSAKNDYVRVRYVVVENESDISAESALHFASTIRKRVRSALGMNKLGMPKGKCWLNAEPPDFTVKKELVEPSGIEPLTSCMPCKRSPS